MLDHRIIGPSPALQRRIERERRWERERKEKETLAQGDSILTKIVKQIKRSEV
jgi:hypothetical protein